MCDDYGNIAALVWSVMENAVDFLTVMLITAHFIKR